MNLQVLQLKLSEFGLNPNDWVIKVRRTFGSLQLVEVYGRRDQAFGFAGWADGDRWVNLNLEI